MKVFKLEYGNHKPCFNLGYYSTKAIAEEVLRRLIQGGTISCSAASRLPEIIEIDIIEKL